MRTMGTFLVVGSIAVCLAQSQPDGPAEGALAPPPAVDQALRERVTKFFQAMVDRKYRQAEQYVAEDTKDAYYNMQKPSYLKFEISKVSYSANFTQANVVVRCDREITHPLVGRVAVKVPQITDWKIENGVWCWHLDPNAPIRTPIGMTKPSHAHPAEAPTGPVARPTGPGVSDLAGLVSADKTEVRLSPTAVSDQVVVTNAMPGGVELTLEVPRTPGLEVKLDHAELGANQTALVLFHYTPQPAVPHAVVVRVQVQPMGQTIPIRVTFEPPAQAGK
jgi:hypothetical protein